MEVRILIDTKKLKEIIALNGLTQKKVAVRIGMSEKTFYQKMKKGIFGSNEIQKMINLLQIKEPEEIFFSGKSLNV